MKKYPHYDLERITNHPTIDYSNPTSNDYMGQTYKAIEGVDDYSYGQFYGRYDHKAIQIYATRFEGKIDLFLTQEEAYKNYRKKLENILDQIRKQTTEEAPPF